MACARGDVCNPGNDPGPYCVNPCGNRCNFRCCLRNGQCQTGFHDDACGSDNAVCTDCTKSGEVCRTLNGQQTCTPP